MKKFIMILGLIGVGILCGFLLPHPAKTAVNPDQPQVAEVATSATREMPTTTVTESNRVAVRVSHISFASGKN